MKKDDAEFLSRYYAFFTLDYEHVVEQLFMCRIWLIAALFFNMAMIVLVLLLCLSIESCASLQEKTGCKPTISLQADNEHKSKRSIANYGHQAMIGFSCTI